MYELNGKRATVIPARVIKSTEKASLIGWDKQQAWVPKIEFDVLDNRFNPQILITESQMHKSFFILPKQRKEF